MSKEPAYRPTICNICHKPLPIAATGRPRKTCSDRCRQIRRRRYDYEGWRYPRKHAKEWRAADRTLRKMEKQYGQRIPDTPPVYVDIYTPHISDRERLLIRLSRGMNVPQCWLCLKPYFDELSPDGMHCSGECSAEARRNDEAVKRGIVMWAGQYDPRVDVRVDMGLPLRACLQCDMPFPRYNRRKKFCSSKCRSRHWREENRSRIRLCPECGESFEPDKFHPYQKYCSEKCSRRVQDRRYYAKIRQPLPQRRRCRACGRAFRPKMRVRHIYCSERCGNRINQHHSRAQKRISVATSHLRSYSNDIPPMGEVARAAVSSSG